MVSVLTNSGRLSPKMPVAELPVWSKTHEASRAHWQDLFQAPISACSGIHNTQVAWNLRVGKERFYFVSFGKTIIPIFFRYFLLHQ